MATKHLKMKLKVELDGVEIAFTYINLMAFEGIEKRDDELLKHLIRSAALRMIMTLRDTDGGMGVVRERLKKLKK